MHNGQCIVRIRASLAHRCGCDFRSVYIYIYICNVCIYTRTIPSDCICEQKKKKFFSFDPNSCALEWMIINSSLKKISLFLRFEEFRQICHREKSMFFIFHLLGCSKSKMQTLFNCERYMTIQWIQIAIYAIEFDSILDDIIYKYIMEHNTQKREQFVLDVQL